MPVNSCTIVPRSSALVFESKVASLVRQESGRVIDQLFKVHNTVRQHPHFELCSTAASRLSETPNKEDFISRLTTLIVSNEGYTDVLARGATPSKQRVLEQLAGIDASLETLRGGALDDDARLALDLGVLQMSIARARGNEDYVSVPMMKAEKARAGLEQGRREGNGSALSRNGQALANAVVELCTAEPALRGGSLYKRAVATLGSVVALLQRASHAGTSGQLAELAALRHSVRESLLSTDERTAIQASRMAEAADLKSGVLAHLQDLVSPAHIRFKAQCTGAVARINAHTAKSERTALVAQVRELNTLCSEKLKALQGKAGAADDQRHVQAIAELTAHYQARALSADESALAS